MYIYADIKWEYADYEGGLDTFRVLSLTDEEQNDLAQYLAPDQLFADLYELKVTLARVLDIPADDIILEGI